MAESTTRFRKGNGDDIVMNNLGSLFVCSVLKVCLQSALHVRGWGLMSNQ